MTSPETVAKDLEAGETEGDTPVNQMTNYQEKSCIHEKQLPETCSPGDCEGHPLLGRSCSLTDITPPKDKVYVHV